MRVDALPMHSLSSRHPGITSALGESYSEAASICLSRHHIPPVDIVVDGLSGRLQCSAIWTPPTVAQAGAWTNQIDATEFGAYAVALASIEICEGLVAIRRAETQTGADYYIAPLGVMPDDLEQCLRLEISGTDRGTTPEIASRLSTKVKQARKGASNLPAIASVVGFKERKVVFERVG